MNNNHIIILTMDLEPIRRLMDADHSCLFNTIAYLVDRYEFNKTSAMKMRQLIVHHIETTNFDESILGSSREEYIDYISDPMNWGGALEIKMFSDIFQLQIVCIDTTHKRVDVYGGDKMYHNTIYCLYDDEHYDPLVMNFDEGCDSETDLTQFDSTDIMVYNTFTGYFM
jgi:ubiquitin thioesterase OTU1